MPTQHFMDNLYIECRVNAKFDLLDEWASTQPDKLVPIIFSHDIISQASKYSGLLRQLASHGFIVFAMDHLDGSCNYTELRSGTPRKQDNKGQLYDLKERKR